MEGSKGYEQIKKGLVERLRLIRGLCCRHDLNNHKTYAMILSLKNLFYLYQKPEVSNHEYLKEFKARVQSMDDYQTCVLEKFPCLMEEKMLEKYDKSMDEATQAEIIECEKAVKKETMTALFIHGADKIGYGGLKRNLAQNMSMGSNQYPRSMEEALNILNTYSKTTRHQKKGKPTKREDRQAGVAFAQTEKSTGDKKDIKDVACYHCKEKGHYARNFEKK